MHQFAAQFNRDAYMVAVAEYVVPYDTTLWGVTGVKDQIAWTSGTLVASFRPETSLAELWLLRLGHPELDKAQCRQFAKSAKAHAKHILRLFPSRTSFPVTSTCQQFSR